MSAWRPPKCKRCNVTRSDTVTISKNGYCAACAIAVVIESVTSMHTRTGPQHANYERARAEGRVGRPRKGVGGSRRRAADQPPTTTTSDTQT